MLALDYRLQTMPAHHSCQSQNLILASQLQSCLLSAQLLYEVIELAQYFSNYVSKNLLSDFTSSHTQAHVHSISYSIHIHVQCLFRTCTVMAIYTFLSLVFRSNSLPSSFIPVLSSIHKLIRQFARCFSQPNFLSIPSVSIEFSKLSFLKMCQKFQW